MSAESFHDVGFHISAHFLSAEVSVEDSVLAAEEVFGVLEVVFLQVVDETGTHVCVVGSRADRRVNHRSSKFVQPSGSEPNGHDDEAEVDGD
jgi:hypothetical protein